MASGVDSVVGGARMGAGNVNPSKLSNTWKLSCLAVVVVTGAAVGRVSNLVAASVTGAASVPPLGAWLRTGHPGDHF